MDSSLVYSAIWRCALFVLGPLGAEVAWLVALRSLPCHMGSSYLAPLTDDEYHRLVAAVYQTGIPGYAAPEPGYTMPTPGHTSLNDLCGPESCGGRSRGSGRFSNKSLTRSQIREPLLGATADLVGDPTQEIVATLEPLIPPQGSPTTMGASPYCLQGNHLVAGLTNTPGGFTS